MIRVSVCRPNTVGVTWEREYESFRDAEDWIERKAELLADRGWELSELSGSSSRSGVIECTHDYEADIMLISWSEVA